MKQNRMIETLKNRIYILQRENDRLNNLLYGSQSAADVSSTQTAEMLQCLEKKKKEYDALICECRTLKKTYNEAVNQMHLLMSQYKKDITHVKITNRLNRIKTLFHK